MTPYRILPRNKFFEVVGGIMFENRGNDKVAMISEIDMSACIQLREAVAMQTGIKPSYTSLVAKAVAQGLCDHPYANRLPLDLPFFRRLVQLNDIDITVAVERDSEGLEQATYAGTIPNTDRWPLASLNQELKRIATAEGEHGERWRLFEKIVTKVPTPIARAVLLIPNLWPSLWVKHRGGVVMISSPAKYGVDLLVGNWPWPIGFSFGIVKDRPIAIDGTVQVRPTMSLIMSFDRRIMSGAPAARFFKSVADKLETSPDALNDESTTPRQTTT